LKPVAIEPVAIEPVAIEPLVLLKIRDLNLNAMALADFRTNENSTLLDPYSIFCLLLCL
jgi:hypothetical protein